MLLKMRGDLGQRSLQLVDLLSGVLDDKGHSILCRFISRRLTNCFQDIFACGSALTMEYLKNDRFGAIMGP